jgi:hypothetical protein
MTDPHCFETAEVDGRTDHPGRKLLALAKRQARDATRKQREIETKSRATGQLRTMIITIGREIANLDDSIRSELMLAEVRDPSHYAYPISVRTMEARRVNLRATIAALSHRLTLTDSSPSQSGCCVAPAMSYG